MSSDLFQQSQAHRLYSLYLSYEASHSAKHEDPECKAVLQNCFRLMEKDYVVGTVANHSGQLCPSYPSELAILEQARDHILPTISGTPNRDQHNTIYPSQPPSLRPNEHQQHQSRPTHSSSPTPSTSHYTPPLNPTNNIDTTYSRFHGTVQEPPVTEEGDQSFDLGESGMMSFQDIKQELDMIKSPPTSRVPEPAKRHILPSFHFRSPRPDKDKDKDKSKAKDKTEKTANVAIKEFMPPTAEALPQDVSDPYKVNDTHELAKQFEKSHFARVRARFVVPCILVRGKNICRSATLSNEVEVFMHSFNQKINDLNQRRKMFLYGTGERSPDKEDRESSLEKQREEDIELLRQLGVSYINDLMVENRKVKYGLKVTSSEKADSFRRYSNFKLVATPYPGVEFFQKFKANKYSARKLCFDWSQNFADAELQLPLGHTDNLGIRWRDYKKWDLIELTQNYLRLYLTHIADGTDVNFSSLHPQDPARSSKGLLIHCISGWDRTPLFISLLRISLWADGEAHQSLTAAEILYLTMGYDWFLFNHLLADRSQRGEDIFYFCFYFLKFIYGEEFSLKSVASLEKTHEVQRPVSQQLLGRSPLLKEIGRVRDGVFRTGPVDLDPNAYVCDECRQSRRFTGDPVGRDVNNSHDAASSTDGKPSSWQLVSFATPPGRDRHGSPRAPFLPTLQGASRTNGSPLNANRNLPGLSEDHKATVEGSLESQRHTSTSPFTLADGRFRLGLQQFNARRSSSSSIPEILAVAGAASEQPHESKRQTLTTGFEFSRVSTSPNLTSHDNLGNSPDDSKEEPSTERLSSPRKRASTFDGGLLLSTGTESLGITLPKEEEEDLTSGDDDADEDEAHPPHAIHPSSTNLTSGSVPQHARLNQYTCQVCHQMYEPLPEPVGLEDPALAQDIPGVTPVSRPSSAQLMEGIHGTSSIFHHDDDDTHGHAYQATTQRRTVSESDREEGVFQLDFDDRPPYHGLDTFSGVSDFRPEQISLPGSDYHGSSGSDRGTDDRALGNDLHNDDDDDDGIECDGIECDGNESFWDETSTIDYGYNSSPLNGLGLGLTKCSTESLRSTGLDVAAAHSSDPSLDGVNHDIEDEDDYGDDDDAASICSQRSGQKSEHHDNDHLFMPSLKGVFSSSDRGQVQYANLGDESNGSCATGYAVSDPGMAHSSNRSGSCNSDGTRPTLTRRQKLRQLRRLFMDIRDEIGDGSQALAGGSVGSHDNSKSGIAIKGQDQERDGDDNGSLKAESFSEDPSFQYKSPIAAYVSSHHRQIPKSEMYDYQQPQFARFASHRPYGDAPGGIVSPVASRDGSGKHPGHHAHGLGVPPSSGRKSPFEWAAAAASSAAASITSSATGIVSGGFGHNPPHGNSGMTKQSPVHPLYEQYHQQRQQPQPRRASRPYPSGSSHTLLPAYVQSPVSGTTTPMDGEFPLSSGERHHTQERESHHRASLSPATTSSTTLNPKHRPGPGAKDKGGESGGRWDW
ncbi:Myotubularin- protein 14 [Podila verticillata]|nr:Myotubularin- protein 14 [Podila verticillata]